MNIRSAVSAPATAAQEAAETAAQTRAEAAKGDQQAVRKLASQQSSQSPTPPEAAVKTTNTGRQVLDARA